MHRLQKEADDANKRSSVLERESQRCELQLGDMAQQVDEHKVKAVRSHCVPSRFSKERSSLVLFPDKVRVLLVELEEARGNHVVHEEDVSSADVSSTSEVISQHLVTFRSVEELQKQNQRLLVALRELGDAQEKEEFEIKGSKYVNY